MMRQSRGDSQTAAAFRRAAADWFERMQRARSEPEIRQEAAYLRAIALPEDSPREKLDAFNAVAR